MIKAREKSMVLCEVVAGGPNLNCQGHGRPLKKLKLRHEINIIRAKRVCEGLGKGMRNLAPRALKKLVWSG